MADNILEVRNLKKYFKTSRGQLHAVDDISFTLSDKTYSAAKVPLEISKEQRRTNARRYPSIMQTPRRKQLPRYHKFQRQRS